ncbi:MAG: ribosome silencing factor [Alphaproteobacteria bacterium]|nr:ribosome silencing factor [Alphaproteobacteria bacterium]
MVTIGLRRIKVAENNIAEQILNIITTSLDDGKANDVVIMDLQGKTSIANYMVVASGTSQRHVAALAEQIQAKLKASGYKSVSEGEEKADWVLIDAFDVIVHIFKPEVREFYSIEKMWSSIAKIRSIDE